MNIVTKRRDELVARIAAAHDGERKNSLLRMLSEMDGQVVRIDGWKKQGMAAPPVNGGVSIAKAITSTPAQRSPTVVPIRAMQSDGRPQDPSYDGAGWSFQLLDHGLSDDMPQTILATDAQGRKATYVLVRGNGRVG